MRYMLIINLHLDLNLLHSFFLIHSYNLFIYLILLSCYIAVQSFLSQIFTANQNELHFCFAAFALQVCWNADLLHADHLIAHILDDVKIKRTKNKDCLVAVFLFLFCLYRFIHKKCMHSPNLCSGNGINMLLHTNS